MRCEAIVEFAKPLRDIEMETPSPIGAEILLKVHNAGVCHSDVHIHDGYFDLGNGQKFARDDLPLPHTLGHEIEGEVVAVGPDVRSVKIGDRRAAFPWIGCGTCTTCLRNDASLLGT